MVDKINGVVSPDQFLTGDLNFYTVRTTLDIRPSATKDIKDEAQHRLDKLVETISTRAQPIIMGAVKMTMEAKSSIADLPSAAAVSGTEVAVYTVRFAVEHNLTWEVTGNNPTLAETLNGVAGFVFDYPTTENNVSVTLATLL